MPIPFGLTPEQFAARFRGQLEQHSPALLAELRSVLATPIGRGVTSASVEISLDVEGGTGPSIGVYFDGEDKKVDRSDSSIFPGRHLALADYLRDLQPFHPRYFASDDFRTLDIQADVAKAWFAEWWWKAGGWDYPLPVAVTVHDDFGDGEVVQLAPGGGAAD